MVCFYQKQISESLYVNFLILILLVSCLLIINFQNCNAQYHYLKGRVTDKTSSYCMAGVSVQDKQTLKGTITDSLGEFRISFPAGSRNIIFSHLGYESLDTVLYITEGSEVLITMQPREIFLGEVKILSKAEDNRITSNQMGAFRLTNAEIMKAPTFLGETDPLGLIRLTPGVQSGSEGNVGFIVRGGGVDQNLILYDNAQVYNVGHILGFFPAFNPETVSDVNIIKSGIPARYGGKLSSVISVNSYKGRKDSAEVKGSVGLVSTRLTVRGPLFNKKGSYMLAARETYPELFVIPVINRLVINKTFFNKNNEYSFNDFSAGFNFVVSEKDILAVSAYSGKDHFRLLQKGINQDITLKWRNTAGSFQWDHKIRNNSRINTSLSLTNYAFDLSGSQDEYSFKMFSSVRDYNLKSVLDIQTGKNKFSAGFEFTEHFFLPNKINAQASKFLLDFGQFDSLSALEGGLFVDDEIQLSEKLAVTAGLRFSFFSHHGPYEQLVKNSADLVTDTIHYLWNESLAFYKNLEPRAVVNYMIGENSSVKASYMRIAQYVHLATSAAVTLPTDVWIPSTSGIKPQIGNQISLGYFGNILNYNYEFSSELFYKRMNNKLEFLRGIIFNSIFGTFEDNLVRGFAQSYGIELFMRKKSGRFNGWISYTLSKTEQKFKEINNNGFYPAKYDRRHDIAMMLNFEINKKWNCSGVFIYASGNAFTIPVGRYIIQGNIVNQYGKVNEFRMPPYHRLDLSLNRKIIVRQKYMSELNISVYNIYNRVNPYFLYFQATGELETYSLNIKALQVSFSPIIPSLSWNFSF